MGFWSDLFSGYSRISIRTPKTEVFSFSQEMLESEHLLIAGTTGCGKSTLLNTFLTDGLSLACCYYLIDLKRTELWQYKGLPNTYAYVNEFSKVESAIDDILYQMDCRFKRMGNRGQKKSNDLPLYLVIDEYADIVNQCPDKKTRDRIEGKIMRLASQGRASNCHLILCTQRCTSDILSSKIKSCITTKIGMRTTSAQESRNIIGRGGLEQLPKYGQIIMISPNYAGLVKGEPPIYTPEQVEERIRKFREFNKKR